MRTVWDIIKSPVITEKALVAKEETQDTRQLLTFRVDRRATKPEIKSAVEIDFSGEGGPRAHDQFHGQDGAARTLRRPQAVVEESYVTLKQGEKPVDYGEAFKISSSSSDFELKTQSQLAIDNSKL